MTKSNSYKQITNSIEIMVQPEFVNDQNIGLKGTFFVWSYHVTITNLGKNTVQLISRYWKIIDETGALEEVKGEGVVGKQPILEPGASFTYSSGVHLKCPSGVMSGHYIMKAQDESNFMVQIPTFSLDSRDMKLTIN